ncbi:hypothetical protein LCGC14_1552930 [marine sediment metagenome]|uniref:Uncharacterized protein n=1 Tax=marine sediment metagenome TaxID=412755 RepID=A0A0F9JAT0_9ZZZZ
MADLKEKAAALLSSTTVAFNANGDTTLYTVPVGNTCVLSYAVVVAGDDAGATTDLSIGQAAAGTDFVTGIVLSNLDVADDSVKIEPIPVSPVAINATGKKKPAITLTPVARSRPFLTFLTEFI